MNMAPLRIIVGFSPGSASDDIANLIAQPLAEQLQRAVTIERIAGDNGARGALATAHAVADGNTLFVATLGTHALAPHVRENLPYDAQRDFAPVSLLTQAPMLLACNAGLPFYDVPCLIAHAHTHPSEVTYGTSAIGGAPHLAAELFQCVAGVRLRHARYDETQQLYADLESGHIALSFNNIMSMLPRCQTGKLRALAVTAPVRSAVAPQVPTLAQAGVAGGEVANWVGLVAPRGTPPAVVHTLAQAIAAVMWRAEVTVKLHSAGITPRGTTAAEFAAYINAELARWKPVVARFAQA